MGYFATVKIKNANGEIVDLVDTDALLYQILLELRAMRIMLTSITGSKIDIEDIIE